MDEKGYLALILTLTKEFMEWRHIYMCQPSKEFADKMNESKEHLRRVREEFHQKFPPQQ